MKKNIHQVWKNGLNNVLLLYTQILLTWIWINNIFIHKKILLQINTTSLLVLVLFLFFFIEYMLNSMLTLMMWFLSISWAFCPTNSIKCVYIIYLLLLRISTYAEYCVVLSRYTMKIKKEKSNELIFVSVWVCSLLLFVCEMFLLVLCLVYKTKSQIVI